MHAALRIIPKLLEQARKNLVGNGRDLWIYGTKEVMGTNGRAAEDIKRMLASN